MILKMHFEFNKMRALRIRKLTEVWARENHVPASTQAFMDALIDRAYEDFTAETRATYYGQRKQA